MRVRHKQFVGNFTLLLLVSLIMLALAGVTLTNAILRWLALRTP